MLKGATSSGFEYEIVDEALDNMELIDALAELDSGKRLYISRVLTMMLGEEQKKRLYEHCRNENGIVQVTSIEKEILDMLKASETGKN